MTQCKHHATARTHKAVVLTAHHRHLRHRTRNRDERNAYVKCVKAHPWAHSRHQKRTPLALKRGHCRCRIWGVKLSNKRNERKKSIKYRHGGGMKRINKIWYIVLFVCSCFSGLVHVDDYSIRGKGWNVMCRIALIQRWVGWVLYVWVCNRGFIVHDIGRHSQVKSTLYSLRVVILSPLRLTSH